MVWYTMLWYVMRFEQKKKTLKKTEEFQTF